MIVEGQGSGVELERVQRIAVRPFVDSEIIANVIAGAQKYGAAIAGVPAVDTVKQVDRTAEGAIIVTTIPRERVVLAQYAEKDDAAPEAYLRLMELAEAAQDWTAVAQNAQRYLEVNPLVAPPYRFLAKASEKTNATATAMEAYRSLLELDPPDPGELHFRLAQLLHAAGDPGARRQVLQALEEAPRYREALRLLLEITEKQKSPAPSGTGTTE